MLGKWTVQEKIELQMIYVVFSSCCVLKIQIQELLKSNKDSPEFFLTFMCNSWKFNLELKSKTKAMPVRTFPLATFAVSTILICLATLLSRNLCLRFCLFFFWILESCVLLGSSQRILSRFWFYFSIENTQQDQRIIFNLVSFSHFNTNAIVHYRWTSVNLATYSQMD